MVKCSLHIINAHYKYLKYSPIPLHIFFISSCITIRETSIVNPSLSNENILKSNEINIVPIEYNNDTPKLFWHYQN